MLLSCLNTILVILVILVILDKRVDRKSIIYNFQKKR